MIEKSRDIHGVSLEDLVLSFIPDKAKNSIISDKRKFKVRRTKRKYLGISGSYTEEKGVHNVLHSNAYDVYLGRKRIGKLDFEMKDNLILYLNYDLEFAGKLYKNPECCQD